MKDIIKKVLRESLGVPKGLLESSKILYDEFLKYFSSAIDSSQTEYNFIVIPPSQLYIDDMLIHEVEFTIKLYERDDHDDVDIIDMGIKGSVKLDNSSKPILKVIGKKGKVSFTMNFIVPENWTPSDVLEYMDKDYHELLSSFVHELKHEYDEHKKPFISLEDRIDYESSKEMIKGVMPLRKLAFLFYFTHKIENLVRPSELASLIQSQEITKENFIDFIKNHKTYEMLKDAMGISYESLIEELLPYSDKIREIFNDNDIDYDDDESDIDITKKMLHAFYVTMANDKISSYVNHVSENIFEKFLGFVNDRKDVINYTSKISKYESDSSQFYKVELNKMNKTANKLYRKIIKLYDLAK